MAAVPYLLILAGALIPTLLWVFVFYRADFYEREPLWLVTVAFVWGAVPAIVVSLLAEIALGAPLSGSAGTLSGEIVEASIVAPVVEEIVKALALFAIFRKLQHEFDGVIDGLTYGALVGFGFSMTENVFYYIGTYREEGGVAVGFLMYLRGIVFGLNHAVFTGLTGIGFGLSRHSTDPAGRALWPILGLFFAILAHASHNFGAVISSVHFAGPLITLGTAVVASSVLFVAYVLGWKQEQQCSAPSSSKRWGSRSRRTSSERSPRVGGAPGSCATDADRFEPIESSSTWISRF